MATTEQIQGGFKILQAVTEAIKEVKEIPSGHLYANLCGIMDLQTYERVISILTNSTVIRKQGDLLIWNVEEK